MDSKDAAADHPTHANGHSPEPNPAHLQQGLAAPPTVSRRNGPSNEYVLNVAFFSFIGFVLVQAVFAIIAKSEAMLADSEAMSVDAMTYLLNLIAERIKHTPYTVEEMQLSPNERHYRRELLRLYLEFLPPFISVITLIFVTVVALQQSLLILRKVYPDEPDDVSLPIMLIFSSGNLLLDILNVTCFARAHNAFGLQVVERETPSSMLPPDLDGTDQQQQLLEDGSRNETSPLLMPPPGDQQTNYISTTPHLTTFERYIQQHQETERSVINLNMCSAWTHVCADTLRSVAVLVAAAIATFVPGIESGVADAVAAVAVSVIILASLIPLLHGLYEICCEIYQHWTRKPK